MKENHKYIYGLIDPNTGDIMYVGQTKNPRSRLNIHRYDAKKLKSKTTKNLWYSALMESGIEPSLKILVKCDSSLANFYEKRIIRKLRLLGVPLTNIADGGVGGGGLYGKDNHESHPIILYENKNFVKEFECISECARYLKCKRETIKDALYRKNIIKGRYQVMDTGEQFIDFTYNCRKGSESPCSKWINITENGQIIKTLKSTKDVAEFLGSSRGSVKMAVRHNSLHKKKYVLYYAK